MDDDNKYNFHVGKKDEQNDYDYDDEDGLKEDIDEGASEDVEKGEEMEELEKEYRELKNEEQYVLFNAVLCSSS